MFTIVFLGVVLALLIWSMETRRRTLTSALCGLIAVWAFIQLLTRHMWE